MSQNAKASLVVTDKTVADRTDAKEPDAKGPAFASEPSVAKQPPPDDAMVRQILERQAVFGF
jgi:hypothetical protein